MKQLTQDEFDALGDGPHDAREVGVPYTNCDLFVWDSRWIIAFPDHDEWWFDSEGLNNEPIRDLPIWHKIKLPADFEGDV